jgi:peroxiredoxin Q/BCP
MIEVGTQAPTFTLPNQDGDEVALTDFKGQTVVVYFYPKADTPGCTTQACCVRDASAEYAARGVSVLGISPDPVAKVKKFHDKQALDFTLLADEDHAVCEQFGTWVEKSMYGNTYMGAARATFIIDGEGTIVHVLPKVQPKQHEKLVFKALAELGGTSA